MLVTAFGFTINAQDGNSRFGVTAGYLNANSKIESEGLSGSAGESGFFFGLIGEFEVSDKVSIQPELLYANVDDLSFLQIPVMAKVYVSEEFSLQAGPQITYTLEEVADDFTKVNLGLGIGFAYDFTNQFFVESRYTFQLNNYYTGSADIESRIGWLNIGVGYKFN